MVGWSWKDSERWSCCWGMLARFLLCSLSIEQALDPALRQTRSQTRRCDPRVVRSLLPAVTAPSRETAGEGIVIRRVSVQSTPNFTSGTQTHCLALTVFTTPKLVGDCLDRAINLVLKNSQQKRRCSKPDWPKVSVTPMTHHIFHHRIDSNSFRHGRGCNMAAYG